MLSRCYLKSRYINLNKVVSPHFISILRNYSSDFEAVVGLEIHAQIASNSKLFSGASTVFGLPANSSVSLFDASIPGTLPVLNKTCVEAGVMTALALSCKVNPVSTFDRKHYFYADLPAGYQITQQRYPLASNGLIEFQVYTPGIHKKPYVKYSKIKQIQLEQDSGKSLHDIEAKRSLVDLNRAGVPLMEFVFEPDLCDGEEAAALVKELSLILMSLGSCSCKMEEGALRVDANVSIHRKNEPFGTRTEIKNIGSIRGVAAAVSYEIKRQKKLMKNNEKIVNETRSWDAEKKETVAMRDKEKILDYRFMPEPNLPPLILKMSGFQNISENLVDVEVIKQKIPILPKEKRKRLVDDYNLSPIVAVTLVNEEMLLQHFENIMSTNNKRNPKNVGNLLINDFVTALNKNKIPLSTCTVPSIHLGEIIDMLHENNINLVTARKILQELINGNNQSPKEIVSTNKWDQIVDETEITNLCLQSIERNQNLVKMYKSGKNKVFGALIGDVAKASNQRADMEKVVKKMEELLKK